MPKNALPTDVWERLINKGIAKRAGDAFLSYPAFHSPLAHFDTDTPAEEISPTPAMAAFAYFAQALSARLGVRRDLSVVFVERLNPGGARAAWGKDLRFSVAALGRRWFNGPLREEHLNTLIHEFTHETDGNHFSEAYFRALSRLSARIGLLAIREPAFFDLSRYTDTRDAA